MTRKWVLTVDEFAERIGVSRATAYRMIAEGRGPRVLPRHNDRDAIRIAESAFQRWLDGQDDNGNGEPEPVAL
jgi:excisionase family DNA binding protein